MSKKILYSCDTGVDDALALAYLAAQEVYRWMFYSKSATPSLLRNLRNMQMKNSSVKCMPSFTFALLW